MLKRFVCISSLLAITVAITGCTTLGSGKKAGTAEAAGSSAASGQAAKTSSTKAEYIFRLGYGGTNTNPVHITAVKMAEWINEKSQGKIEIKCFPGELLGTDKQMTEMVAMGTLDMNIGAQAITGNYAPKMAAIELPFLFDSFEKVEKVLDGPIGEEMAANLPEEKGFRLLAYWDNGFRNISNNVRPLEKAEDLKGLKIRAPETKTTITTLKAMGSSPAPLAYPEVYLALSQHVFDGVEQPIANMYTSKFYEVQKYHSVLNYKYEPRPLQINESLWKGLPDEVKEIIKEGAVMFAKEHRRLVAESEGTMLKEMTAAGMKTITPDLSTFKEATKNIYTEWEAFIPKEMINAVVEAAK